MPGSTAEVSIGTAAAADPRRSTVHVFGAGFSKGAGLPLCKDLFREMDRFIQKDYESAYRRVHGVELYDGPPFGALLFEWWDELRERLIADPAFQDVCNLDSDGFIEANIESVLDIIDTQIASGQTTPSPDEGDVESRTDHETLWRFALVNCLAYYIRWATEKCMEDNVRPLMQMAKYVCNFVKPGDSIISLNYDDIAEQMLIEAKNFVPSCGIEWHQGDGYGVVLPEVHLFAASKMIVPLKCTQGSNVRLFNLHGQAKWTWDEDNARLVLDSSLTVDSMKRGKTGWTHCRRPLIAEPRREKPLEMNILAESWKAAEQELRAADQVVVVGYSFPAADGAAERMFKDCLADNDKEIIVIDPAPREQHRIVELFGDRVAYRQTTLVDFVQWVEDSLAKKE